MEKKLDRTRKKNYLLRVPLHKGFPFLDKSNFLNGSLYSVTPIYLIYPSKSLVALTTEIISI